jgi:hypothetical protein
MAKKKKTPPTDPALQTEPRLKGRPTDYNQAFHDADLLMRGAKGHSLVEVAAKWGVHRDTIHQWRKDSASFSDAYKVYKDLVEAWYVQFGRATMTGQLTNSNTTMYIWLTKNLLKWSDRNEPDPGDGHDFEMNLED